MADTKITALTALTGADPANDVIPIVDVSDTTMAASGTTKKISVNNILGASGTATLASATITGALTVGNGTSATQTFSGVTNILDIGFGSLRGGSAYGDVRLWTDRFRIYNNAGTQIIKNISGTNGDETWYDGAGGTRMTLNSTGLGVGVSPGYPLHVQRATAGPTAWLANSTTYAQLKMVSSGTNQPVYVTLNPTGTGAAIFQISDVDRLTIDTSGNVGIGIQPSAWAVYQNTIQKTYGAFWTTFTDQSRFGLNCYYNSANWIYTNSNYASIYEQSSGQHRFYTAPSGTAGNAITFTQAMTLDASGRLLVAKTTSATGSTGCELQTGAGGNSASVFTADGAFASIMNRLTSDGIIVDLRRQTLSVGNISVTTTGATFNSTSDYRLKESVQPLTGGLARVSALKPSIYKWKADGSNGEGFLAHELAEVVPAAVSGEKDAVNEDGSIKPQGVDMSRVVPILVAAIQELTARVQTLETR